LLSHCAHGKPRRVPKIGPTVAVGVMVATKSIDFHKGERLALVRETTQTEPFRARNLSPVSLAKSPRSKAFVGCVANFVCGGDGACEKDAAYAARS